MSTPEKGTVKNLLRYLLQHHSYRVALVVFSTTLVTLIQGVGMALLVPLLSLVGFGEGLSIGTAGRLTDWFIRLFRVTGFEPSLKGALVLVFLLVGFENLFRFLQRSYAKRFVVFFANDLKVLLYQTYLNASWPFWLKKHVGQMVSLLTLESTRVELAADFFIVGFLSEAMLIVAFIGLAFTISWQFSIAAIMVGGALFLIFKGGFQATDKLGSEISNQNHAIQETIQEHLNASKLIKSYSMEKESLNSFRREALKLAEADIKGNIRSFRIVSFFGTLTIGLLCIGLYSAIRFLNLHPAQVLVILLIFYRILTKVSTVQERWHRVTLNAPAFDAVMKDLTEAEKFREQEELRQIKGFCPQFEKMVVFNNVGFSYGSNIPAVHNINIKIPARKTIALVGESGSGKSTLLDLILGLQRPQEGTIEIDGVDINKISLKSWRDQIGYVTQETALFFDTIRNNIRWGNLTASDDEIERAARLAHAQDFIRESSEGYETRIGNRGARLSGGERQRIALARAILRHPRLLILDEATSSLDAVSEKIVQEAIDELAPQMSIIIVAHRLATVRSADWIYVIDNGKVIQEGTWDQLIQKQGKFSNLWQMQSGFVPERSELPA